MRTSTRALLAQAREAGTGLAAFNVMHLESAEAIATAAERVGVGVVLQISERCVRFHGGLRPLAAACLAVAGDAAVPLSVHLDHAQDPALALEAIALGLDSIMIDQAHLDDDDNVRVTREVRIAAHASGVHVEAELGEVGGKDGAHAPGVRTDPEEARAFQAATGVDALAVAVGSSHAMLDRSASLDLDRIAAIRALVPVPLVLHGSSGVPDDEIRRAIAAGMTKINVATQLTKRFTAGMRHALRDASVVDSRVALRVARERMTDEAEHMLRVIATPAAALAV